MNPRFLRVAGFLAFILFLTSCVPTQKMRLVQSGEEDLTRILDSIELEDTKVPIRPNDDLYIEVNSISSLTQRDFNFFSTDSRPMMSGSTDYTLISYSVNDSGYVRLPVIGSVKLAGHTLEEAAEVIEQRLNLYITNPSVKVKYVNRQITVLGEVLRPGTYSYNKDKMSILQGIGLAGDFSYYANREKVVLLRTTNDSIMKINIDLLAQSSIQSEHYYLQNNDIIYVEPMSNRKWGIQYFPFSLIMTTISTLILTLSFISDQQARP